MPSTIANVTPGAVEAATGRDWDAWFEYLDEVATPDADHRTLLTAVRNAGVDNAWWQQKVANGYEQVRGGRQVDTQVRGGRQVGEMASGEYQLGVQRTLPVDRATLWTYLIDPGVPTWLGSVDDFIPAPNAAYETGDGTTGEVRTVAEGERLRLTWHPRGLAEPAVLQVLLSCPRNRPDRTTLRIHMESIPDATVRDELRAHWQAVLDRIQAHLSE